MFQRKFFLLLMMVVVLLAASCKAAIPTATITEAAVAVETEAVETEPAATEAVELLAAPEENLTDACVVDFQNGVDYFPQKTTVAYAEGFTIDYYDNFKVITVTQPWSGSTESYQYILLQCGTTLEIDQSDAIVVEVPIKSIATMSSTYFTFLEEINKLDTLVGIDDATYVVNPTIQAMAADGSLTLIGGGAGGGIVNVEAALDLNPDIIMTSASGMPEYDAHPKLLEAGLSVVLNSDYLETSPLGRAEWGKFIAAFYNMEAQAAQTFDAKVSQYETLTNLVAGIEERPTVFANTDYQGTWYVPGGASYAAIFMRDAGADYIWQEDASSGALPLAFEVVYDQAKDADYWINVGFASDLAGLLAMDARYGDFTAVQNGHVFNYNKVVNANGGVDYYESGVANPHLVLADLIKIFHPDLLPDYAFTYYQILQ